MFDAVALVLIGLLALQIPIAVLVHIDARRIGIEHPEWYDMGIIVPAAGFLVIPYYLSNRRRLAREAAKTKGEAEANADADGKTPDGEAVAER